MSSLSLCEKLSELEGDVLTGKYVLVSKKVGNEQKHEAAENKQIRLKKGPRGINLSIFKYRNFQGSGILK